MNKIFFCRNSKNIVFAGLMLLAGGGWGNQIVGQGLSIQQTDDACNAALELVYKQGDSTQALKKMRQIEKQVSAYPTQKAVVQLYLGGVYMQYPNTLQQAFDYLTKAKPLLERANEWCHVGEINTTLASVYFNNADMLMAQKYIAEAEKNFKKCDKESYKIRYYVEQGNLSVQLNDSTEAQKNYGKGIVLAKKHANWRSLAGIYTNLAVLNINFGKIDRSIQYLNEAAAVQKKYGYNQSFSFYYLAQVYMDYLKDDVQAKPVIQKLIEEQLKGGEGQSIAGKGYALLAQSLMREKKYDEAKIAYEQQLKITSSTKLNHLILDAYTGLSDYYKTVGDKNKALDYLEKSFELYKKVSMESSSNQVQQKQALYNLDKKNEEIEQLEKDKRTQQIMLLLGILAAFGGIGIFLLILRNRKIEKQAMQARLELQGRELLSNTIYIEQRNEVLENIKQQIREGQESGKILGEIERSINFEKDWEKFKLHFEQIHPDFFKKLLVIEPSLTDLDLKQCAYLKLGLSPKQVANLLNVTPHAVSTSRTRIKKRLNLQEEKSLADFINALA